MQRRWISLETVAHLRGISLAAAKAIAGQERWPTVFKLHETLVLAPA